MSPSSKPSASDTQAANAGQKADTKTTTPPQAFFLPKRQQTKVSIMAVCEKLETVPRFTQCITAADVDQAHKDKKDKKEFYLKKAVSMSLDDFEGSILYSHKALLWINSQEKSSVSVEGIFQMDSKQNNNIFIIHPDEDLFVIVDRDNNKTYYKVASVTETGAGASNTVLDIPLPISPRKQGEPNMVHQCKLHVKQKKIEITSSSCASLMSRPGFFFY